MPHLKDPPGVLKRAHILANAPSSQEMEQASKDVFSINFGLLAN
jgi:hypothetical protein